MALQKVASLTFEQPRPYSFELTISKPAGWSWLTPGEIYDRKTRTIWSALRMNSGRAVGIRCWPTGKKISCEVYDNRDLDFTEKEEMRRKLTRALGLQEDLIGFYKMAKSDTILSHILPRLWGMREGYWSDLFSGLCLVVLLQMAPINRSIQMFRLLQKNYGERLYFDGKTVLMWPSPKKIAVVDVSELQRRCKLGYRAKTLKRIARQIVTGFPTLEELADLPAEEAKEKLMELYGVVEYSAEMVSPHTSFPLDVWSVQIFGRLLGVRLSKDPRESIGKVKAVAEKRWGVHRGIVLVYVLNSLKELGFE